MEGSYAEYKHYGRQRKVAGAGRELSERVVRYRTIPCYGVFSDFENPLHDFSCMQPLPCLALSRVVSNLFLLMLRFVRGPLQALPPPKYSVGSAGP